MEAQQSQKPRSSLPIASASLQNIQGRLFVQLGAVLLITILISGIGAFFYFFLTDQPVWLLVVVGLSLTVLLGLGLMSRILKQNLGRPLTELQLTLENLADAGSAPGSDSPAQPVSLIEGSPNPNSERTDDLQKLQQNQEVLEALETKVKTSTGDLKNANERLQLELQKRQQTEAELRQQYRELTTLQAAIMAISSSLDLRYVLDTVAQEMVKLLGVERCLLSAYDPAAGTVVKIAEYHLTQGWWDSKLVPKVYQLADYPLTKSVLEEQVVEQMTITQTYIDPAELAFMHRHKLKSLMMLPMVFQRQVVGLVELQDSQTERSFSHQEISSAKLLANQAASAIENARLYQKAQQEIIERKQAEASLQEERELLARRVKERTVELSKANAELARAARLKDEFLAAMSHELRTPLNVILGSAEILREEVFGPLNEKQLKFTQNVEEGGRHLLDLINDILDLSKIEAGKAELDLGPVSVQSVCEASLRLVKQLAHKKELQLTHTIDEAVTTLLADERRLKQILVNLLSNAIKFTPEGGRLGLEVKGDVTQQAVHFTVWDTGIGISRTNLDRLFQPFVQLDSRLSRQYPGSGLGLSLVSRMVEMHGAFLWKVKLDRAAALQCRCRGSGRKKTACRPIRPAGCQRAARPEPMANLA